MTEHIGAQLALILALGVGSQWLAWRMKLPAILFLLLTGIAVGPVLGLINPDTLMGDLLFPGVSLGVAIILFEGALTLKMPEISGHGKVVTRLISAGAIITWLLAGATAHYLFDLSWEISLLFGGLVSVTGPTVIVPILRTVKPRASIAGILRWEGILIDPIGALLVVLVFEYVISGRQQGHTLFIFGEVVAVGVALGVAGAYAMAAVLRRHLLPEYLHNVGALAWVLGIYACSNVIAEESGLLAVTLMGMILANLKDLELEDILDFKETLTLLFISVLFIILAARLEPSQIIDLGGGAVLLLIALVAIRALSVAVATWGTKLNWRERALIVWIAPRGIVAAAISALFAAKLSDLGIPGAEQLVPLTFMVIIVTVLVQSLTARPLALALGVCDPEARGVMIFGGQQVGLAIGKALHEQGFPALMADTNWEQISAARMAGLPTYYGNVVSEHADRHLDLIGIGRLFAMSRRPALNALAALRYRRELGAGRVYNLRMPEEQASGEKKTFAQRYRTPSLFGDTVTFGQLASKMSKGAAIKVTRLTDSYSFEDYKAGQGATAVLLVAIDDRNNLKVFTDLKPFTPKAGWMVMALVDKTEKTEKIEKTEKLVDGTVANDTPAA